MKCFWVLSYGKIGDGQTTHAAVTGKQKGRKGTGRSQAKWRFPALDVFLLLRGQSIGGGGFICQAKFRADMPTAFMHKSMF
jgi:hypothetical protein